MRQITVILICLLICAFCSDICISQWQNKSENYPIISNGSPRVFISDGTGGAFLLLTESWDIPEVRRIQRLNRFGYQTINHLNTDIADSDVTIVNSFLVESNPGTALLLFDTNQSEGGRGTYIQRIDSLNTRPWGENGIKLNPDSVIFQSIDAVSDNNNGAYLFFAWIDSGNEDGNYDLKMIHADSEGNNVGNLDGIVLDNISQEKFRTITSDDALYILYYEKSDTNYYYPKINKISEDTLFFPVGITTNFDSTFTIRNTTANRYGVTILATKDTSLVIQRMDPDGNLLWGETGIVQNGVPGAGITKIDLSVSDNGATIYFWHSEEEGISSIYSQKTDINGNVVWSEPKNIDNNARLGSIIVNNENLEIILTAVIQDEQYSSSLWSVNCYKINSDSEVIWKQNVSGKWMVTKYENPGIINDGKGGAIVTWTSEQVVSLMNGTFVQQISKNGNLGEVVVSIHNQPVHSIPNDYKLYQSYPNPFNSSVNIRYSIPVTSNVKLTVYNITGKEVAVLKDETQISGEYIINWNGKNQGGIDVSSGVYVYRMEAAGRVFSKKMILLK